MGARAWTGCAALVLRLADEPGLEPAPQLPTAKAVDEIVAQWFVRQLTAK